MFIEALFRSIVYAKDELEAIMGQREIQRYNKKSILQVNQLDVEINEQHVYTFLKFLNLSADKLELEERLKQSTQNQAMPVKQIRKNLILNARNSLNQEELSLLNQIQDENLEQYQENENNDNTNLLQQVFSGDSSVKGSQQNVENKSNKSLKSREVIDQDQNDNQEEKLGSNDQIEGSSSQKVEKEQTNENEDKINNDQES